MDCTLVPDYTSKNKTIKKGVTSMQTLKPRPDTMLDTTLNYTTLADNVDTLEPPQQEQPAGNSTKRQKSITTFTERTACGHTMGSGRESHQKDGIARGTKPLVGSKELEKSLELTPMLSMKVESGDYDENALSEEGVVPTDKIPLGKGKEHVEKTCDHISVSHKKRVEHVSLKGTTTVDMKPEPGSDDKGNTAPGDETSILDSLCPRFSEGHKVGQSQLLHDKQPACDRSKVNLDSDHSSFQDATDKITVKHKEVHETSIGKVPDQRSQSMKRDRVRRP